MQRDASDWRSVLPRVWGAHALGRTPDVVRPRRHDPRSARTRPQAAVHARRRRGRPRSQCPRSGRARGGTTAWGRSTPRHRRAPAGHGRWRRRRWPPEHSVGSESVVATSNSALASLDWARTRRWFSEEVSRSVGSARDRHYQRRRSGSARTLGARWWSIRWRSRWRAHVGFDVACVQHVDCARGQRSPGADGDRRPGCQCARSRANRTTCARLCR